MWYDMFAISPTPPLAERDQTQHPAQSFNPVQADITNNITSIF